MQLGGVGYPMTISDPPTVAESRLMKSAFSRFRPGASDDANVSPSSPFRTCAIELEDPVPAASPEAPGADPPPSAVPRLYRDAAVRGSMLRAAKAWLEASEARLGAEGRTGNRLAAVEAVTLNTPEKYAIV